MGFGGSCTCPRRCHCKERRNRERERERNCEHYISVSVPFFSCLPGLLKVFIFEWKKKRREKWQHQHILKKDNTQKEKNRRQGEKERIKDNTKKKKGTEPRTHSLFRVDTFAPLVISSNSIGAGQEIRTCPYWGVCSHVLSVCRSSFRTVGGVWIVLIRQYGCGRWRSVVSWFRTLEGERECTLCLRPVAFLISNSNNFLQR